MHFELCGGSSCSQSLMELIYFRTRFIAIVILDDLMQVLPGSANKFASFVPLSCFHACQSVCMLSGGVLYVQLDDVASSLLQFFLKLCKVPQLLPRSSSHASGHAC